MPRRDSNAGTPGDDADNAPSPDPGQGGCAGAPLASDSFVRPSFTLEQIRTFLAVAAREHITQAAKTLRLSQPAVTQQVHLLERALGVRLLEKVGRNIRLTDAGVEVAGACLLIMRSLENLEEVVRSVRGLEIGSVAVGASQVAANYYLSSALASFAAKHPSITVDIIVTDTPDTCEQVSSGRLECGLVDAPVPRTNLVRTRIATDEVLLVAHPHHPLVTEDSVRPHGLEGHRYLMCEPPGAATEQIASDLLGPAYERLPRIQLASLEAVRQSVLAGLGFAAMPHIAVRDDLCRGALARINIAPRSRPIYAVRRPGRASLAAEAFWTVLANECPAGAAEAG